MASGPDVMELINFLNFSTATEWILWWGAPPLQSPLTTPDYKIIYIWFQSKWGHRTTKEFGHFSQGTSWAGRGRRGRSCPEGWCWWSHSPPLQSCGPLAACGGCSSLWWCSRTPPDTSCNKNTWAEVDEQRGKLPTAFSPPTEGARWCTAVVYFTMIPSTPYYTVRWCNTALDQPLCQLMHVIS